jgi:hypothetical protein
MPSPQHEALHRIFQQDTGLLARTLERLLGISLPHPCSVSVLDTVLTELNPIERRVDTLLLQQSESTKLIFAIESQLDDAKDKPASWAYYIAHLHAKHRCPVILLVVCADLMTAKWARGPHTIGLDGWPSLTLTPIVYAPDNVPVINELAEASKDIVLTVFSALTHGRSPQVAGILEVLAAALDTIDTETAGFLAEFTEIGLGQTPARQMWRNLMSSLTRTYQSEYAQMIRAEGRAEGEAKAVLRVLERRGITVSSAAREQILACTDTTVLDGWLDRALDAASVDDVFA